MQDGRRRLVGVVDDDAAVRDSLRFLLEAANFMVVTFHSAGQFLADSDRNDLACLLLDHHMPEMTGLELLRRLRRTRGKLPIALMTGSPSAQLSRQALELGATVVLEKPLAEQALFDFVGNTGI
ncbi:MAG TPA: response regulator [Acetobacteraceae bacterium]|jgi:two-component system, LuxR family, response regulator FixJ|nr:response regulator [Acetobacteraceae bacterium]